MIILIFCFDSGKKCDRLLIAYCFNNALSLIRKNDINNIEKIAIKILPRIPIIDWKIPLIAEMSSIFVMLFIFVAKSILIDVNFLFIS